MAQQQLPPAAEARRKSFAHFRDIFLAAETRARKSLLELMGKMHLQGSFYAPVNIRTGLVEWSAKILLDRVKLWLQEQEYDTSSLCVIVESDGHRYLRGRIHWPPSDAEIDAFAVSLPPVVMPTNPLPPAAQTAPPLERNVAEYLALCCDKSYHGAWVVIHQGDVYKFSDEIPAVEFLSTIVVAKGDDFSSCLINGSYQYGLGECQGCLLRNPTPWYETFLNRLAETTAVPLEYRCYEILAVGRHPTHNQSGLGERKPHHANAWWFLSREDVVAELALHSSKEDLAGLTIVDKRDVGRTVELKLK